MRQTVTLDDAVRVMRHRKAGTPRDQPSSKMLGMPSKSAVFTTATAREIEVHQLTPRPRRKQLKVMYVRYRTVKRLFELTVRGVLDRCDHPELRLRQGPCELDIRERALVGD